MASRARSAGTADGAVRAALTEAKLRSRQFFKMAAKSGATVTLGLTSGSAFSPAPPPSECKPIYLANDAMVISTHLGTADATFWSCPGYFMVEISRVT